MSNLCQRLSGRSRRWRTSDRRDQSQRAQSSAGLLSPADGQLVRACAATVTPDITVVTETRASVAAQKEAFDRILGHHMLYCTVCDNNNGNCTVHNTAALLRVEHQTYPFRPKPYEKDLSNPFYRYDPDQCILCGRCVEACQNVQVNETLSIRWEDDHPRVLWDGGHEIGGSSCVSCGHCITVCPCNALMEKSMLGHAGYFTKLAADTLFGMIDVVKAIEPEIGYGPILQVSETEAAMREARVKRTKTVCTYCAVRSCPMICGPTSRLRFPPRAPVPAARSARAGIFAICAVKRGPTSPCAAVTPCRFTSTTGQWIWRRWSCASNRMVRYAPIVSCFGLSGETTPLPSLRTDAPLSREQPT